MNEKLLGHHEVYCEPFRFDVTNLITEGMNNIAVRIIDGPAFGQPSAPWSIFPDIRADEKRYVPDSSKSVKGAIPIGYHSGGGFGIFKPVYLETTGEVEIENIFASNKFKVVIAF